MNRPCAAVLLLAASACAQIGPSSSGVHGDAESAAASEPAESIWREQKLIRNGEIDLEVDHVAAATDAVASIAAELDGIVADSESAESASRGVYARIRVRVPSDRLDDALNRLAKLGTVVREGVSTDDVTKAYFDLETRLAVKRKTSGRLLDLLNNRTGSLADVVAAEAELSRITEEIEVLEGEKRFYDHRIATSTVDVSLDEREGFFSSLLYPVAQAFEEAGPVLGASISSAVYLVIFAGPWALLVWTIVFIVRRIRRNKQVAA